MVDDILFDRGEIFIGKQTLNKWDADFYDLYDYADT